MIRTDRHSASYTRDSHQIFNLKVTVITLSTSRQSPILPTRATPSSFLMPKILVKFKGVTPNRCTTTTTTTVLHSSIRDYPGEPVPEETCTHSPIMILSNLYQLFPSITIHSILPVQFTCLTIFLHNFSPSPLEAYPTGISLRSLA